MRLLWRAGGQRASQKRVQRKLVFHIFRLCCLHIRRPSRILYGKRALILRAGCEHTGVLTRGAGTFLETGSPGRGGRRTGANDCP